MSPKIPLGKNRSEVIFRLGEVSCFGMVVSRLLGVFGSSDWGVLR